jgi:hypothetical protein
MLSHTSFWGCEQPKWASTRTLSRVSLGYPRSVRFRARTGAVLLVLIYVFGFFAARWEHCQQFSPTSTFVWCVVVVTMEDFYDFAQGLLKSMFKICHGAKCRNRLRVQQSRGRESRSLLRLHFLHTTRRNFCGRAIPRVCESISTSGLIAHKHSTSSPTRQLSPQKSFSRFLLLFSLLVLALRLFTTAITVITFTKCHHYRPPPHTQYPPICFYWSFIKWVV